MSFYSQTNFSLVPMIFPMTKWKIKFRISMIWFFFFWIFWRFARFFSTKKTKAMSHWMQIDENLSRHKVIYCSSLIYFTQNLNLIKLKNRSFQKGGSILECIAKWCLISQYVTHTFAKFKYRMLCHSKQKMQTKVANSVLADLSISLNV